MAKKLAQVATLLAALAASLSVSAAVQAVTKETDSLLSPITGTGIINTGIIGSASLEHAKQIATVNETCQSATPAGVSESNRLLSASDPATLHHLNNPGNSGNQATGCCLIYYQGQWYCISC